LLKGFFCFLKYFSEKEGFYKPFVVLIISDRKNRKNKFFLLVCTDLMMEIYISKVCQGTVL